MKSKIFLDIDQDNKPIIKIKSFDNSDDLKDKFLRQFLNNNRPKRKSLDISLSEAEREYESQLETDELVSAIGLDKIMMIDAEVLEIKLTNFNKSDNSSAVVWRGNNNDNQESWSEYTIQPKGYVYLLSATKTVKTNSKEYYEWERYCNCCSEGGQVYDYKIKYNIKLEEAADYIKRGFDVTFANEIEVNILKDKVQFKAETEDIGETIYAEDILEYIGKGYTVSLGDYKLINVGGKVDLNKLKTQPKIKNLATSTLDEIYKDAKIERKFPKSVVDAFNGLVEAEKPKNKKFDEHALYYIAKTHATNFNNSGITTFIGNNNEILELIIKVLENEFNILGNTYHIIQDQGLTTLKKIKNEVLIPLSINNDLVRNTGRTTRLADEYIQMLFNGEKIVTYDHDRNISRNQFLFDKILRRLEREHNINTLDFIILSKSTCEMQLKIN